MQSVPLPPRRQRLFWCLTPKPGRPLVFTPLCNKIESAFIHWHLGRSILCTEADAPGSCEPCLHKRRKMWQGWLAAGQGQTFAPFVACVSDNAGRFLQALIDQGSDLRRMEVSLHRTQDRAASKVEVKTVLRVAVPKNLPAAFDVWPSVLHAMGCQKRQTGLPPNLV